MKKLLAAAALVGVLVGCAHKGAAIPGAPIPFAKADYTVLGATNAQECGSYIFGIDWQHIFKNEQGMILPGSFTVDGAAGTAVAGMHSGALTPEGRRALYMAMEKMPEATHLLAPKVKVESKGIIMGPIGWARPIFGQRCATVEAHGVKIGDRPTNNQ